MLCPEFANSEARPLLPPRFSQFWITLLLAVVAAFASHAASIPTSVLVWGKSSSGSITPPPATEGHTIAIAAADQTLMALLDDGSVVCWGSNGFGQLSVPQEASHNIVAISAGYQHCLALNSDGGVIAWGDNTFGQTSVPTAAQSGVIQIAAGGTHSLALKSDGSLIAWGNNSSAQSSPPTEAQSGISGISAGENHSLALKKSGSVIAWGDTRYHQCEVPTAALTGVIAVSAGGVHSLALKENGSLVEWGNLSTGEPFYDSGPFTAISTGTDFNLALRNDRTLFSWSISASGVPAPPETFPKRFSAIAGGRAFVMALMDDVVPVFTQAPASQTLLEGTPLKLEGSLLGKVLSLQWQKDGVKIPGATNLSLTLRQAEVSDTGNYSLIASNTWGSTTSAPPAVVTVTALTPPTIVRSPPGQNGYIGLSLTLSVQAAGSQLSYQWRKDGMNIAGATSPDLFFPALQTDDTGSYTVVVSNRRGAVTNNPPAIVFVLYNSRPSLVTQPHDATVSAGTPLRLAVQAVGLPGQFQWFKDGVAIPDATNSAFVRIRSNPQHSGNYTVVFSALNGSVTSAPPARVIVNPAVDPVLTGGVFDPTFSVPVPPEAESGVIGLTGDLGRTVTYLGLGSDRIPYGTLGYEERLALRTNGTVAKWVRGTNSAPNYYDEYQNYQILRPVRSQALGMVPSYPDVLLTSEGSLEAESRIDIVSGISLTPTSDETAFVAIAGANRLEPGPLNTGYTKTHLVALRNNGAVVELTGRVEVPLAGQSGVQAIAAGTNYTVALGMGGSVGAWTFPDGAPIATHPALQTQVQSIAADTNAFAAVLANGTMVFQKLDGSASILPAPTDAILASGTPSFAITRDHRALTWDGSKWKPAHVPGWTQGRILGRYNSSLLVLEGAPIIQRPPESRTVFEGRPLDLSVDGGGPGARYQWLKNGTNIANATNALLHLDADAAPFAGAYTVVITNRAGSITSAPPALVTVAPAPPSGLISVSSDSEAGTPLTTVQTAFGFSHSLSLFSEGLVAAKFNGPLFTKDDRTGLLRRSSQDWGQWIVPPEALNGVVEIYAAAYTSLARKSDGTLIYWGGDVPYGTALVSPPSNVRSIASGSLDWMLTESGGVVRWDRTRNVFTQDGVPEAARSGVTQLINYNFTGALKADGTVIQLGTNPVPPEVQSGGSAFATVIGYPLFHVAALWAKTDGSLFTWGYDGVLHQFAAKIPNVVEISSTTSYFDLNRSFPAAIAVRTADGKAYYVRAEDPNPTPVTIPSSWLGRMVSFSMTENGSAISAVLRDGTRSQSIQFTLPDSITYSPTPIALTATASSELPVIYHVVDGPALVSGNQLTLTGTGTVTLVAEQPGTDYWTPATPVQRTVTVVKASQSIQFATIPSQPFTASPISLVASSSSGLPVTLRVMNGPAVLDGNQLTLTGVGDITIIAEQAGTSTWNAAVPVARSFTVSKASQSIEFAPPGSLPFSSTPIPLTAKSSSGLEVFFRVIDGPGTIVGKSLQPTGRGMVVILAFQLGNQTFKEASILQIIFITSAPQQISFTPLESPKFGGEPVIVSATASSGLPVQFSVLDGPGVIENGALRATGLGAIRVVARQPGDTDNAPATEVIQTVMAIPGLDLILPTQAGGFGALKIVLPSGQTAVIEQSDSLGIWTSIGPVFGFGANTPLFVSLTSSPSDPAARFWRVRVD